jgi:hypothetical protein
MKKIAIITIPIALLSCVSPVKVIRGPGYLIDGIEKRTLVVVPFIDSVEIKYSGDVSRELAPGMKEKVIERFVYNQIKFGLNDSSIFQNVVNDTCLEPPFFIPKGVNKTYIPHIGTPLFCN